MRRGLYLIVDLDALDARDPVASTRSILETGCPLAAVQLRAKQFAGGPMVAMARDLGAICRQARVPFYVNDRVDVALAAGADGVHVGQTDLPVADTRRLAPNLCLGVSTHTPDQIRVALEDRPTYVAYGPVFATGSKRGADPTVGLDGLAAAVRNAGAREIPLVAIGGITLERAGDIARSGATAGAVISAVWAAPDPVRAALDLHEALGGPRSWTP